MQEFLDFFEFMPVWQKLIWILSLLVLFWILEGNYAFAKAKNTPHSSHNKKQHAITNLKFLLMIMGINIGFGLAATGITQFFQSSQIGILHLFELPVWIELVIAILFLDFISQYIAHYIHHNVPKLWRLHVVHHADTHIDVTSGTRQHPLEFILRESLALVAIMITGMPIAFYLFYRIITILFTYWTHADIKLPLAVDKALSYVIVTPNMHKFHHHHELPWTDSNYGNVLAVWDRLLGTFIYENPADIIYGVDIIDPAIADDFKAQMKIPWSKDVKWKA